MKRLTILVIICTVIPMVLLAQSQHIRVILVDSDIPSAEIEKGLSEHCPDIILTRDSSKADYELQAQYIPQTPASRANGLTLFDKNGDMIFFTTTDHTGNAVKDVCNFIKKEK